MLKKKKRVTKELFQTVIKSGSTLSGHFFIFRFLKQKSPQYAFVVSKKIAKRAVVRNKLRRQGYNALKSFPLKDYAGIFFFKKQTESTTFNEIKDDIESILNKLR